MEAVVGDQIWLMPGCNDRSYRDGPYRPVLGTVTKVARIYLTVEAPEGARWIHGLDQYDRESGAEKSHRGFSSGRAARGYEERRQRYYLNMAGELGREIAEMGRAWEIDAGRIKKIEEVAFVMDRPSAPDYSDPEFKE